MNPQIDLQAIQDFKDRLAAEASKAEDRQLEVELAGVVQDQVAQSGAQIQQALVLAISSLIKFLAQHEQKVSVANHPDPITMDSVVEAVNANTEEVKASNERLDSLTGKETDFTAVIETLKSLEAAIHASAASRPTPPTSVSVDNHPDLTPHFDNLNATLSGLPSSFPAPVVNAPAPDLTPIQQQLQANSSKVLPPQLNLATYRAHDMDEQDPDVQYIGFINVDGYWYILRNDLKKNSMRYVFGYGNYMDAWTMASTLSYLPLEEAIKAISESSKKSKKK